MFYKLSSDTDLVREHYSDVIMGAIVSQITSLTIVYSTVYSDADQRKHRSSASLAFVRGIHRWSVNSPHKRPVTRKMFLFDDVIMNRVDNVSHKKLRFRCVFSYLLTIDWTKCASTVGVNSTPTPHVWSVRLLTLQAVAGYSHAMRIWEPFRSSHTLLESWPVHRGYIWQPVKNVVDAYESHVIAQLAIMYSLSWPKSVDIIFYASLG